jgi:hypothetical protein
VRSDPSLRTATSSSLAKRLVLSLLGRSLDVLDHSLKLSPELLLAVVNTVHVCARTGHALNDPAGLPDVLVSHSVQRKLR